MEKLGTEPGPKRNREPVFPSNTHKERAHSRPKITPVGQARRKEKSLGSRIAETFAVDDMHSVGNVVLFDVIIPTIKAMLQDVVSEGTQRLLFGDSRRRNVSNSRSTASYTSYNRYYDREPRQREEPRMSHRARMNHNFDEIILEDRMTADTVLDSLSELVDRYDSATVADLYELVGFDSTPADIKWGWTSMAGMSVLRDRSGYILNLPKPIPLD